MKSSIVVLFIFYIVVPSTVFSDDNRITYFWIFDYNNDSLGSIFSEPLRIRFESMLQKYNNTRFVTRLKDTLIIPPAQRVYTPQDCAILFENTVDYLIRGAIWKPADDGQVNVSIKLYNRVDSENVTVSNFKYSSDFVKESREIDLIAHNLAAEIYPALKVDELINLSKAEELINLKKKYLDEYKKNVDSLLKRANVVAKPCSSGADKNVIDTVVIIKNDFCKNAANVLIPVYGMIKSLNTKENILHSTLYNLLQVGTLAGSTAFLIESERDRNKHDSGRYKQYGTSLLATAAVTSLVNGIIVAHKLKHKKSIESK